MEGYPISEVLWEQMPGQLCMREPVERALAERFQNYEWELDWWNGLVDKGRRQGDLPRTLQTHGGVNLRDAPEGNSWDRWADWISERLGELVDNPDGVVDLSSRAEVWFRHDGLLPANSGPVLESAFAKVELPDGPTRRDYLQLDVGVPLGSFGAADWNGRLRETVPTSRVGVVLERAGVPRVLEVHAVVPTEDVRAQEWRARWPTASSLLGGWFSLGSFGHRGGPLMSQYWMLSQESDEVLERFAGEGRELLELPDEELRAALIAFGCAVEISWVRTWLEWMFWRIDYFDWK